MRTSVEWRVEGVLPLVRLRAVCLLPAVPLLVAACLLAGLCPAARAQVPAPYPDTSLHSTRVPRHSTPPTFDTHHATRTTLPTALVLLEHARVDAARLAYRQARSWKRLLPNVNVHASLSTRGHVFPALSSIGYDPAYAALQQWPGDTWGVSVSWRLDQLMDTRARETAEAAYHTALRARDVALARLEAEARAHREQRQADSLEAALRLAALADEMRLAQEERAILADLLRLARLRYEAAEIPYETLQRARLALLAKEAQLVRLEHEKVRLEHGLGHRDGSVTPTTLHTTADD